MTNPNVINNGQKVEAILSSDSNDKKLDGNAYRKIAQELVNESEKSLTDSKAKEEQAKSYFMAASAMDKLADGLRKRAEELRNGGVSGKQAAKEVNEIVEKYGLVLEFPVPKNASPELLEQIADRLENKAKENRGRADEFLRDAEKTRQHADNLRKQAEMLTRKDANFSDAQLKYALAQNEGLILVFKKLGVYKLDAEYKEQVAYVEKKATDQSRLGY